MWQASITTYNAMIPQGKSRCYYLQFIKESLRQEAV